MNFDCINEENTLHDIQIWLKTLNFIKIIKHAV